MIRIASILPLFMLAMSSLPPVAGAPSSSLHSQTELAPAESLVDALDNLDRSDSLGHDMPDPAGSSHPVREVDFSLVDQADVHRDIQNANAISIHGPFNDQALQRGDYRGVQCLFVTIEVAEVGPSTNTPPSTLPVVEVSRPDGTGVEARYVKSQSITAVPLTMAFAMARHGLLTTEQIALLHDALVQWRLEAKPGPQMQLRPPAPDVEATIP